MSNMFKKATKERSKLRMAISGPAGAGKTKSALLIGENLGSKIALIDTEKGSASKYSDKHDFDVCEITENYNPQRLIDTLRGADAEGYDVVIVDSLTHFWNEPGGFLDLVEEEVKKTRARGGRPDTFAAWKIVDPIYRRLINAILTSNAHVICTMRAKTEYERSTDAQGKSTIRKVGLEPVFRKEGAYEFDIEGLIDNEHNLVIGKTRCDAIDGRVFEKPGREFANIVKAWLESGVEPVAPIPEPTVDHYAIISTRISECVHKDGLMAIKNDMIASKSSLSEEAYSKLLGQFREKFTALNA